MISTAPIKQRPKAANQTENKINNQKTVTKK